MAAHFNITEGDVLNAWKHWEKAGIVKLDNLEKDISVTFLQVNIPHKHEPAEIVPLVATRPQYSPEELALFRQKSGEVAKLFNCAEQALGKMLSYNDMNAIFSFHDWLRLPMDVIEFLLSYCAENDHRNLRYLEKCAMDWADNNVSDVETAKNYVLNFDKNYRTILHYMGQTSGYPTPSHRKYIDKWLDDWKMPLDLIMESCDRCVMQIDKPKFSYVDKILAEWHKKGIFDIVGVKIADAEFAKSKETADIAPTAKTERKPKINRFVNFVQRENDYSNWEQMERAYQEKRLKTDSM